MVRQDTEDRAIAFYKSLLLEYGLDVKEFQNTKEDLADIGHISQRTVVRYIDILEDLGLLKTKSSRQGIHVTVLMNLPENK